MIEKNEKEEAFCQEYIKDRNTTEAYVRAGFVAGNEKNAWRYFNKPAVQARIKTLLDEQFAAKKIMPEDIIVALREIQEMTISEGSYANAIKCLELMGKSLGMWKDKQEIEIIDTRTDEELEQEIARLYSITGGKTDE